MINSQVPADGEYFQELRGAMLSLVQGSPKRVLEVGCATGQTLAWLRERGAEHAVGIEYSPEAAALAEARGVGRILVGDIEQMELDLEPASFDLLIAGHVLEHLADPWKTLRKLREYLRPGGQFVGALPNVRHHSVVIPLLFKGRWEYQRSGVMDWTHLRFFSRETVLSLVKDAGLEIDRMVPEFGPKSQVADSLTLHAFGDLLAYAFNLSAFKPNHE